ncbi:hypothetical protein G6F35_014381 [Rhizopus arrhizus]|nr:hypothetical protein G6F35_014381 [Rhizopus arrhizus]
MHPALERHGRLHHPWHADALGWRQHQARFHRFVHAGREIHRRDVHPGRQPHRHQVDGELAALGDVAGSVLGRAVAHPDAHADQRRVARHQVEEREGRHVRRPPCVARHDPGDGARHDRCGQQLVAGRARQRNQIEEHGLSPAASVLPGRLGRRRAGRRLLVGEQAVATLAAAAADLVQLDQVAHRSTPCRCSSASASAISRTASATWFSTGSQPGPWE